MSRLIFTLACLLIATPSLAANPYTSKGLKDVYYGEALYHAFQGDWFQAIARPDTEMGQYRRLDEPGLDTLNYHIGQAEFGVGDFELGYRMHLRAGRAMTAVIEANVAEPARNYAIYRLARLYFRKDQPENAQHALERIHGEIPSSIQDDVKFLRGEILLATGSFPEAAGVFRISKGARGWKVFRVQPGDLLDEDGKEQEGRTFLDRTGQIVSDDPATLAIKDKANLVLGYKLLDENVAENAKQVLERVRLSGPFSNRALWGWVGGPAVVSTKEHSFPGASSRSAK